MTKKTPDHNDMSLWLRFVETIKPLHPKSQKEHARPQKLKTPTPSSPRSVSVTPSLKPQTKNRNLDGRTETKLRKGKLSIEGTLDLHGMTQDQAHQSLNNFVMRAYAHHKRCVLVITGKGARSESGTGVLKTQLPHWLSVSPLCDVVLKHVPATDKHGGGGAFYLYLKRNRD